MIGLRRALLLLACLVFVGGLYFTIATPLVFAGVCIMAQGLLGINASLPAIRKRQHNGGSF